MIKKKQQRQLKMEFVCLDELVPNEHILKKIDRTVDFEFIREKTKNLYSQDNGRPAVDPVVLFKMLFIGYLFGIRSERQLVKDIQVNVAYRWFLGFDFTTKVPDASTISQNLRRRFNNSTIYQDIFDEIVLFAMKKRLVDGKHLYTDSTHLKANANKNKFVLAEVQKNTRAYLDELDKDVADDREAHGKKPLKPQEREPENKEIRQSTTDPESGFMVRDGKPRGFFYLDHRTVDGKLAIITDTYVTPANVHDSIPYLERLDRQRERFGFSVEAVGLDAGYNSAAICKGLEDRNIFGVVAYRSHIPVKGRIAKRKYQYDAAADCYICPNNCRLRYQTTERGGNRLYSSDPSDCRACPLLSRCTASKTCRKVIARHVWEASRERAGENRLSEYGKRIYARRKETVERSFADAKQLHGHRYARMRGRQKVQEQSLLCAWSANIKKIALALTKGGGFSLHILLFVAATRIFVWLIHPYKHNSQYA
jgi:transposase